MLGLSCFLRETHKFERRAPKPLASENMAACCQWCSLSFLFKLYRLGGQSQRLLRCLFWCCAPFGFCVRHKRQFQKSLFSVGSGPCTCVKCSLTNSDQIINVARRHFFPQRNMDSWMDLEFKRRSQERRCWQECIFFLFSERSVYSL